MRFALVLLIAACRSSSPSAETTDASTQPAGETVTQGHAPRWLLELFGAHLPEPPPPPLPIPTPRRPIIGEHHQQIVACYQGIPNLHLEPRRSLFIFTIGKDGRTRNVKVETTLDPRLAECWRRAISRWVFNPPPKDEQSIVYPWSPQIAGPSK